jgi:hypothetical protein
VLLATVNRSTRFFTWKPGDRDVIGKAEQNGARLTDESVVESYEQ